jgi:hypothetical protein
MLLFRKPQSPLIEMRFSCILKYDKVQIAHNKEAGSVYRREDTFTLRVSVVERQLITIIAQRLERTESDTVRFLLREKARELGVTPTTPKEDRQVAQAT